MEKIIDAGLGGQLMLDDWPDGETILKPALKGYEGQKAPWHVQWMRSIVIKPKLHVFGHMHEAYGECVYYNGIHLVNASHVNERYQLSTR